MARFLHENDNFFRRRFLLLVNCLTRQKISTTVLAISFPLWIVQLNEKNAPEAIPSHFFFSLQADAPRGSKDIARHLPKTNSLDAKRSLLNKVLNGDYH